MVLCVGREIACLVPGPQKQVRASGWAPYWTPMVAFLVIVELSGRVSEPFAPVFLVLRVIAPLGLFAYFALRGEYPELRGARWMRSYITPDGRRAICEFQAPDPESVREAFRSAGQPFDRAWAAKVWWREE